MTNFYEKQPDVLPLTLPKGTRSTNGFVTEKEVRLERDNGLATYRYGWETPGVVGVQAAYIDWSSVPIEPTTPSVESCAACGARDVSSRIDESWDAEYPGVGGLRVCASCGKAPISRTAPLVRARRTAKESTVTTHDGPELDCHCGHAGCSRCDTPPIAAPLCSTPECAARMVVATHGERCVYCDYSTDEGKTTRVIRDEYASCATATNPRRDKKAGDRLAAWGRAERRRVNRADQRELAKPHPWESEVE